VLRAFQKSRILSTKDKKMQNLPINHWTKVNNEKKHTRKVLGIIGIGEFTIKPGSSLSIGYKGKRYLGISSLPKTK